MKRINKINYYLNVAESVAERGTCLRRNFGAIIDVQTFIEHNELLQGTLGY